MSKSDWYSLKTRGRRPCSFSSAPGRLFECWLSTSHTATISTPPTFSAARAIHHAVPADADDSQPQNLCSAARTSPAPSATAPAAAETPRNSRRLVRCMFALHTQAGLWLCPESAIEAEHIRLSAASLAPTISTAAHDRRRSAACVPVAEVGPITSDVQNRAAPDLGSVQVQLHDPVSRAFVNTAPAQSEYASSRRAANDEFQLVTPIGGRSTTADRRSARCPGIRPCPGSARCRAAFPRRGSLPRPGRHVIVAVALRLGRTGV